MAKREPLHIPVDFETTVRGQSQPPSAGTPGSRKAKPRGRKRPAPGGEALVRSVTAKASKRHFETTTVAKVMRGRKTARKTMKKR